MDVINSVLGNNSLQVMLLFTVMINCRNSYISDSLVVLEAWPWPQRSLAFDDLGSSVLGLGLEKKNFLGLG